MTTYKSFQAWRWTAHFSAVILAALLQGATASAQDVNPTLPLVEARNTASQLLEQSTCHSQTPLTDDGFSCTANGETLSVKFASIDYVASRKKSSQWCIAAHDLKNKKGDICWQQKENADRFASAVNRLIIEQNIDWSLSPWKARRIVDDLLKTWVSLQASSNPQYAVTNLSVTKTGFSFSGWTVDTAFLGNNSVAAQANISFKDMRYVFSSQLPNWCLPIDTKTADVVCWKSAEDGTKFVQAVNILILENRPEAQVRHQAVLTEFQKTANAWRASGAKMALPEEARRHKVLAENAVQEKNFEKAINEYEAGLAIYPTWPDGQYNLALLCGETGNYDEAVQHMEEYLVLAPDAPDALAAKDKIIIWQDKIAQP